MVTRTWTGPYLVWITAPVAVCGADDGLDGDADAFGAAVLVGPGVVGASAAGRLVGPAPCDLKLSRKISPVTVVTRAIRVRRTAYLLERKLFGVDVTGRHLRSAQSRGGGRSKSGRATQKHVVAAQAGNVRGESAAEEWVRVATGGTNEVEHSGAALIGKQVEFVTKHDFVCMVDAVDEG
jgi:hypothetical protein